MKRYLSLISALAVMVIAVGVHFGFHPADAMGILELCVDWVTGFTAHTDGLSLALVPVLASLRKKKADLATEARTLLDKANESGELAPEDETRFNEIMASIEQVDAQIKRQEQLGDVEVTLNKPDVVRSVESGNPDGDGSAQPERHGAAAGRDRGLEARMAHNTLRMLHGVSTRNHGLVVEAQRELARDGHYGVEVQQRAASDYYSTLVDADGAVLLPTVVVQEIEEISEVLGIARQLVTTFNHITGTLKVPGATGTLRASAVAEGGEMSSSMRAFKAVSLNPKKWAIIVPWTYEAILEAGPQILADAQRAIARGFAFAEDDALFNGDGTSAYNSIDGILSANRTDVADYVLPGAAGSFDDLAADDVFLVRRKIPPAVRAGAVYCFHPDMEPVLRTLKDGNGQYIFAYNDSTNVATLGGRPVRYTEVLPASDADDVETTFGVYGYFPAMKMAIGEGMSSEDLREGTIPDADTGADINLASQDLRALKVREFFDMDCNFESVFCKITTAATDGEGEGE